MKRAGFSLVEVTVAMTLLSVGMLSIGATAFFAARVQSNALLEERVTESARSVLDSLVANAIAGSGTIPGARFTLVWSATPNEVVVRALGAGVDTVELRARR